MSIVFSQHKKATSLSIEEVGGKAYHLALLKMRNTPAFYAIKVSDLEPYHQERVEWIIKRFCKKNKKYAVRSSALDEDSKKHSFAGIHASYLNVHYDEIEKHIKLVMASAFSKNSTAYRKRNNIETNHPKMAVLLQEMVDADYAGVINTINPTTNNINEIVISVCKGLGDKLVDGQVDGTTYFMNGENQRVTGEDILSKKILNRLMKLSKEVSAKTDAFQDIEFAVKRNKVYFLQARDIVTYQNINPHNLTLLIDNSNIIESYYGVTSPLTFSFAKAVYKDVYTATLKEGKVRQKILDGLNNSLSNMLYYYEGKIYYNLKSWYHVSSIFSSKKAIMYMESMMGVKSSNAEYNRVKLNFLDIAKIGIIFMNKLRHIEKLSDDFVCNFNEIVMPYYGQKIEKTNEELRKLYEEIENKIVPEFTTSIINDCAVMFYFGRLKDKAARYENKTAIINQCTYNGGDVESAKSGKDFLEIIRYIRQDKKLLNDFNKLTIDELYKKYYQKGMGISLLIEDYIFSYGSRVMNELKLETTTMIEDPQMIFSYLQSGLKANTLKSNNACVTIPKALIGVSNKAKKFIKLRERLRLRRTYVFSVVRNIFLNYGRNYVAEGRIDKVEDIFYLTKNEILLNLLNVKEIIVKRKMLEQEYKKLPIIDRAAFYGDICLPIYPVYSFDTIQGIPSGSGEVHANVSLMESTKDTLKSGSIILTKRTDPGWISLFPLSSGLIVEHGSMLSHSFVVARELSIPAVVGVSGATTLIKDNDRVHLDGVRGVVKIEN